MPYLLLDFFLPFFGIPFQNGRVKTVGNISGGNIYRIRNIREKKPAQNSGLTKVGLFFGGAVQACDVAISQVRNFSLWIWKAD